MSFLNLASGQLHRVAPFRSVAKRALFLAMLLLPGGLVVMPLVWWLDRYRARGASPQPDGGQGVTNEGQNNLAAGEQSFSAGSTAVVQARKARATWSEGA